MVSVPFFDFGFGELCQFPNGFSVVSDGFGPDGFSMVSDPPLKPSKISAREPRKIALAGDAICGDQLPPILAE
jgi:hypothetical protein